MIYLSIFKFYFSLSYNNHIEIMKRCDTCNYDI